MNDLQRALTLLGNAYDVLVEVGTCLEGVGPMTAYNCGAALGIVSRARTSIAEEIEKARLESGTP